MKSFGIKQAGEQMARSQPTGRYGQPEDMAGIALFLVSPASAHVTGAHIVLDGGATIAGSGLTGNDATAALDKAKL